MRWLLVLLLSAPSLALAAKAKVVLDAPKPVSGALEKALKAKYTVVKKTVPEEPTGGDVKEACRAAGGAVAVVTARKGGDVYTVMVLNGADGSPLTTLRVKGGRKPVKALPKPDAKRLLSALSEARPPKREEKPPPPPPEDTRPSEETQPDEPKVAEAPKEEPKQRPSPSEPPPPPSEDARDAEDNEVRASVRPARDEKKPFGVRVGVGFKMFDRRFGYTDDIFDRLSTYYLPRGPALAAELELYPGAFLSSGPASWVGVLAQFDYAVGIASRAEDGTRYGTQAMNLRVALAGRIPVSVLTIQPFIGFARQSFAITTDSTTATRPNIPSVGYNGLRGGLNLRINIFGPVAFQAGVAGTALLSTGELGVMFPRSRGGAMDANAALAVQLMDLFELRVGGDYQRYWFSMNPEPGDENVAGGALDIYLSGNVTLSFKL